MSKKSFSIHTDFYTELRNLTPEQRGEIMLVLINWADDAEQPELDPICAMLVRLIKAQNERISTINSSNGKNGGAPKGNNNASQTSETTETSEEDNNKRNKRNKPSVTVTDTITNTETKEKDFTPPLGVLSPDGEPTPKKPNPPGCPHAEIVKLYHEILPELPQVKDWGEPRQEHLRARWRSSPERQTLGFWREYFMSVRNMDWLMGRKEGRDGRPFLATLEWLVRLKNFDKVIEGFYLNRAGPPKPDPPPRRVFTAAEHLEKHQPLSDEERAQVASMLADLTKGMTNPYGETYNDTG